MKKIIAARSIMHALAEKNTVLGRSTVAIHPACSSEEILNLHGVHRADLIITESRLPVMGGRVLCSTIRSSPDLRNVSIVMVCEAQDLEACRGEIQANAFVPTPVDPVQLFSTVSELLVIPQRKALRVLTRVTIQGGAEGASFFGMIRNISISGMLMDTDHALRKGDRFACAFTLARREIRAECAIVRVRPKGGRFECGAAFVNLDTKSMIIIEQYVKAGIRH